MSNALVPGNSARTPVSIDDNDDNINRQDVPAITGDPDIPAAKSNNKSGKSLETDTAFT